jgi:hypothetical protein
LRPNDGSRGGGRQKLTAGKLHGLRVAPKLLFRNRKSRPYECVV